MGDPGDEKLMAYADGELPAAERVEIEAMLAGSAGLRARLTVFSGTGVAVLRPAYAGITAAPVPERLIATVMGAARSGASGAAPLNRGSAEVVQFRRPGSQSGGVRRLWPAAVAAGIVTAVAAVSGLRHVEETGAGAVGGSGLDMAQLAPKLGRLLGGETANILGLSGAEWSFKPSATFAANDGRWCREFTLQQASSAAYAGAACRSANGRWQLEAVAEAKPANPTKQRPAGKVGAGPSAVDEAIQRLGNGTPILPDEEERLIKGGWKR